MGMIGHFLDSYPQEDNWAWGRWYIIGKCLLPDLSRLVVKKS